MADNGKTPVVTGPPDLLGTSGRANVAANILLDLQTKQEQNEAIMVANGQEWNDAAPFGDARTYAQRHEEFVDGVTRLLEHYADIRDDIDSIVAQRLEGRT